MSAHQRRERGLFPMDSVAFEQLAIRLIADLVLDHRAQSLQRDGALSLAHAMALFAGLV
jgi:hypothetical protein